MEEGGVGEKVQEREGCVAWREHGFERCLLQLLN